MPVEHDPLTQIVNVQWVEGGGIFVGVDGSGFIYYSEIRPETEIKDITIEISQPFGYDYTYNDISAALIDERPVFVAVTDYTHGPAFADHGAAIFASRDGKSWTKVLDKPNEDYEHHPVEPGDSFTLREFVGVVYDTTADRPSDTDDPSDPPKKGMFYAVAHISVRKWPSPDGPAAGDSMEGDQLFSSQDGFSWTEGAKNMTDTTFGAEHPSYPSSIKPYCTGPDNANGIPDGFQGYSEDTDTLVFPDGIKFNYFAGADYSGNPSNKPVPSVTITRKASSGGPSDTEVSMPCYAVTGVGRTWMAVGGSFGSGTESDTAAIDVALNDGKWQNVLKANGKGPIVAVAVVPISGGK